MNAGEEIPFDCFSGREVLGGGLVKTCGDEFLFEGFV